MRNVLGILVVVVLAIAGSSHAAMVVGGFTVGGSGVAFTSSTLDFDQTAAFSFFINTKSGDFATIFAGNFLEDKGFVLDVTGNPHGAIDDWAIVKNVSNNPILKIDVLPGDWTLGIGSQSFFWLEVPIVFQDPTGYYGDTPGVMSISGQTIGGPGSQGSWSGTFVAIPEPATIALLGLGGLLLRRKRSKV